MAAIGKLEQELRFDAVVFHFTVHAEKDVMKDFSIVPWDATDDAREKDETCIIHALNGLVERNRYQPLIYRVINSVICMKYCKWNGS